MTLRVERLDMHGVAVLRNTVARDSRGTFFKPYMRSVFQEAGLEADWSELYVSHSFRGVIRGLHYQAPPSDHAKLVFCAEGEIFDVAVDIRRGSPTEGRHVAQRLAGGEGQAMYVGRGLAHGFLVLSESAVVCYAVSSEHDPAADRGIRWDSVDVAWPLRDPVVISPRDAAFPRWGEHTWDFAW